MAVTRQEQLSKRNRRMALEGDAGPVTVMRADTREILEIRDPYTPEQLESVIQRGIWHQLNQNARQADKGPTRQHHNGKYTPRKYQRPGGYKTPTRTDD